ncbi:helix-turn-helix domain-containing protein [Caproicibacter sp.]|uniref:helix-turn-helix domain-containing protein n=1 Tax=Caproicibacter sp. TaxID=2814884 RepID=UPI003989C8B7
MRADYKRLWKLLIDRDMKKKDLRDAAHLSPSLMTKLNKNESLTTNTLARICEVLDCRIEDIMEFVPECSGERERKSTDGFGVYI